MKYDDTYTGWTATVSSDVDRRRVNKQWSWDGLDKWYPTVIT